MSGFNEGRNNFRKEEKPNMGFFFSWIANRESISYNKAIQVHGDYKYEQP